MPNAILYDRVTKRYRGSRLHRSLRTDVTAGAKSLVRPGTRAPWQSVVAFDDVSLEIPEGQSVALVGANGAGKTTALKLAARITYPTTGRLRVRGRLGALIEVGAGMHPDLTGRENVDLYGRILGLSARDIALRFDEMIAFAELEQAIDQPVKQYSSGMQLRLGFSLAVHLEPDVLLVDEALAVGDAAFQYRCIERMRTLVNEGRTLVFVSHDMTAVETLCDRAILFEHGRITHDAPARDVVHDYLLGVQRRYVEEHGDSAEVHGEQLSITGVSLHDDAGNPLAEVPTGAPLVARIHYDAPSPVHEPNFTLGLSDGRERCFALASMLIDGETPRELVGRGHIDCRFDELPLHPRTYELWGSVRGSAGIGDLIEWQRLRVFRVSGAVDGAGKAAVTQSLTEAPVRIPYSWSFGGGNGAEPS